MSGLNNPSSQTQAAAQAATEAALNQIVNTVANEMVVVGAPSAGTVQQQGQLIAPSQKLRKITLTNNNTVASNKRFKFMLFFPPQAPNSAYAAYADHFLGELVPGGSMTIDDPECRSGLYGWCSDAAGGAIDVVVSQIP
jgi:hypothetical protein